MILILSPNVTQKNIDALLDRLTALGAQAHVAHGADRVVVSVEGDMETLRGSQLEALPGVERVVATAKPYKMASREFRGEKTVIKAGKSRAGGKKVVVMAGPCSVESREQCFTIGDAVAKAGATVFRGGAFKPRTSPYSFQGLGEEGLQILAEVRERTGLAIVTEVMDTRDVELVCEYADILQIGARNVQNFSLLNEVGRTRTPVFLKRGLMTTISEFLMSAEYVMSNGNENVILCERGIRTFETALRNTLDVSAVPLLESLTHLPIFVDPSHAVGTWRFVMPMARAAVAAGADGLMIEVHDSPETAFSDGVQSLLPERFAEGMTDLRKVARAVGRGL
ncbi:MAG: 3-deoxy-7-phosphoheptulonate synthase [Gemmatimonadota bacterium]|nr:3-deoxy-7-phosphoheptulonate synthase [Gemmatimonadota bacterium]MDP6529987.1 3-deoxy-7-phosphoheptulonate synthase [Gemmatimonadota bacterium]MDP6802108.1 3-deoxy-7-phosphoheptulonate synthase [Gemmatimonadota bacterium]MDP7032042.1 3-deoxy-7-phosphoheptulonate synthase [Gemmatimonadota bacterium]